MTERCTYPDCKCPFDAPADPTWCARGLPRVSRAKVVAEARSWIGTPWQHQARTKGAGVDCAGLVIGVARALGLVPADMDITHYTRMPDGSLLDHCSRWMSRISAPSLIRPADVLVLDLGCGPQHLAIAADYTHGGLSMIHAMDCQDRRRARVVEHRLDSPTRERLSAAYRLPGIA